MSLHDRLHCDWSRHFESWPLPVSVLGVGEASFAKKLESVSHQVTMVCGDAEQHSVFRKSIFGVMSDQAGTERQFADCGKVHNPEVADAVVARTESDAGPDADAYYFENGVGVTDPMHIIWNAFEDAVTKLACWSDYKEKLSGCLAFLGHPGRRQKWLSTANLTPEERRGLHQWKFRLVDWKWQYMSQMWAKLSPRIDVLLTKLDVSEMRRPISATIGYGRPRPLTMRNLTCSLII